MHSCREHLGSACPPPLEVPAPSTVPPSPAAAAAAASPAAGPATKSAGCSSARWRSHHCSTPTALTGLHGIVGQSPKTQLLHNKCKDKVKKHRLNHKNNNLFKEKVVFFQDVN